MINFLFKKIARVFSFMGDVVSIWIYAAALDG